MEAVRQSSPGTSEDITHPAVTVSAPDTDFPAGMIENQEGEAGPDQAPKELPEEVLARFPLRAQSMLEKLMANAGQQLRPFDFRELFDQPDAASTATKISQYLRQIDEDTDTGRWLYRWGHGGRSGPRICMWGTAEQAAVIAERIRKDTSPRVPRNDPGRPTLPRTRQASTADAETKSAFTDGMALPARRFEPVVSSKTRDSKRGQAVLRAWGLETVYEDNEVRLHIGGAAIAGADTLAAEIVEAVAEVDDNLSPGEVQTMLAEYWDQPPGLKSVIDRFDFLRSVLAAHNVLGWKDSGPVTDREQQRLIRLDFPEPAAEQE